ncbi:MAG: glycosyltransferase family A protein [Selenomonadaceae bacterium]|nr:glycosyltransferase family A protein [Selenomonadaceae bacterium]
MIVPVYNVAPYLAPCIDSLLAQTFRNIELILV